PPGYVGYEEGGYLTEAVRRRPYSIILLDEIEKAHHDVFNILLQVLDEGRLTDSQGRTVDFKNCVIVMTSNIGAEKIQAMTGSAYAEMKSAVMTMLGDYFRPEFINRIDESVVFHALDKENIRQIANVQMSYLQKRLQEQGLQLEISQEALDKIAQAGFDPVYGARPLTRALRQLLENPLSEALLKGEFVSGDTINIVIDKDELAFTKK
ncbi:MAG TPA: AAA family ATPase, partial [Candidatus Berkiella sp.]|nr:AAA family ATPase [Candidatus Berkiella sp.]